MIAVKAEFRSSKFALRKLDLAGFLTTGEWSIKLETQMTDVRSNVRAGMRGLGQTSHKRLERIKTTVRFK